MALDLRKTMLAIHDVLACPLQSDSTDEGTSVLLSPNKAIKVIKKGRE